MAYLVEKTTAPLVVCRPYFREKKCLGIRRFLLKMPFKKNRFLKIVRKVQKCPLVTVLCPFRYFNNKVLGPYYFAPPFFSFIGLYHFLCKKNNWETFLILLNFSYLRSFSSYLVFLKLVVLKIKNFPLNTKPSAQINISALFYFSWRFPFFL